MTRGSGFTEEPALRSARVLAHVHTFNDAAYVEQAINALQRQTRRPDAIVIVDNASADGTLDRAFPENVTIIRNPENLGTSGTVRIGFAHALERGFDWVWIFDADTVPEPDVLEKLLAFFGGLPHERQEQVCFLTGPSLTATGGIKQLPMSFEGARIQLLPLANVDGFTQCDCVLWSGSLFRHGGGVRRIGPPMADYVLDIAEFEYGYRARQLGLTSFVVHDIAIHHDVGRKPGAAHKLLRFGPINLTLTEDFSNPQLLLHPELALFLGLSIKALPRDRGAARYRASTRPYLRFCRPALQSQGAIGRLHTRHSGRADRAHGAPVLDAMTREAGCIRDPSPLAPRLGSGLLGAWQLMPVGRSVRVLAHITTFNEAGFIDQALSALQLQTRRPDAIVIVDNGSTDGTLDRTFPENVALIRNSADLGMSRRRKSGPCSRAGARIRLDLGIRRRQRPRAGRA